MTESPSAEPAAPGTPGRLACAGVLLIGYGNTLRSDDGAGPAVAELLQDPIVGGGGAVVAAHQLLPEHAELASQAELVIFVDATTAEPAGWVALHSMAPHAAGVAPATLGHHLTPQAIVTLAHTLFGSAPRAVVVSIGGADFSHGDRVSAEVAAALPRARDLILSQLAGRH